MSPLTEAIQQRMQAMTEELKRRGIVSSSLVARAFTAVPRHLFISHLPPYLAPDGKSWVRLDPLNPRPEFLDRIYSPDAAILFKPYPPPTSSSAPCLMAMMLEALELSEGLRVLEIGAGSGYNAALLAHIVGEDRVYTVDNQPEVAGAAGENLKRSGCRKVRVICADGGYGYSPGAPYDRVIATASIFDVPVCWREQLAEGGILVAPVWMAPGYMPIVKLVKRGETLCGQFIWGAAFMALQGDCGYEESGCRVDANEEAQLAQLLDQPIAGDSALPLEGEDGADPRFPLLTKDHHRFMAFNAFVNLMDRRATGLRAGERASWLSLWDRDAASLAVVWTKGWKLGVYGNEEMYIRLLALLNDWKALGAPEISSYRVEVVPEKRCVPGQEGDTLIRFRSWHTWAFSLDA